MNNEGALSPESGSASGNTFDSDVNILLRQISCTDASSHIRNLAEANDHLSVSDSGGTKKKALVLALHNFNGIVKFASSVSERILLWSDIESRHIKS